MYRIDFSSYILREETHFLTMILYIYIYIYRITLAGFHNILNINEVVLNG